MRLKPQSGKTFPPVPTKKLASPQNPKKIFPIVTLSFALDFERGTMAKERRACSSSKCTKGIAPSAASLGEAEFAANGPD